MSVWLVAEDRVQIVRADSVVSFTAVPVKPTGYDSADPVARLPSWDRMQILAATTAPRNAETLWTALITFKGHGRDAVKLLVELTETISRAEHQLASRPEAGKVLFIHGPLPRLDDDPAKVQVWHISEELPVKGWPTSGSYFRDPLP